MKRLELSFLLTMVCVLLFAKHSYTLTFNKNDFSIELKDSVVSVTDLKNGASYSEDLNAPALPYVIYRVLRPLGASDEKPKVSFDKELLFEDVDIEANPQTRTTENSNYVYAIKTASSSLMSPILYTATQSMYGYTYTMLKITPFVYDAANKELCFVPTISITFDDTYSVSKNIFDEKKAWAVRDFVINPDDIYSFYPQKSNSKKLTTPKSNSVNRTIDNGKVDYAIITSEALKPYFQELLEWKIQKGLRAKIYTLDEIYSSIYVSDYPTNTAKIRKWISDMYYLCDLKYVLIGGDTSVVPIQYCFAK